MKTLPLTVFELWISRTESDHCDHSATDTKQNITGKAG